MEKGSKMDIKEVYERLFDISLKVVQGHYDKDNPYNNLEECCISCNNHREQLIGMLRLMKELNVITYEEFDIEFHKVINVFSTHKLFNAYIENGEVMVWSSI